MNRARPFLLAAFALVPFAAAAIADDEGVPMGPLMCLYGYNDYRPCDEGSSEPADTSSGSAPSYVPEIPPDPMTHYLPRYNAALSQLQRLVGGLDDIARAAPTSEEEMSARLTAIYAEGAYRLDSVNAVRNHDALVIARSTSDTGMMTRRIAELEAELATATARKQAAVAKYEAWAKAGGAAEHRHLNAMEAAFQAHDKILTERADLLVERIAEWLWVAGLPAAARSPRTIERKRPPTELAMQDYPTESGPTYVMATKPRAPMPHVEGAVGYRAPLTGTLDQKLTIVEALPARIAAATEALARSSPDAAEAEARAAAIETRMHALEGLARGADAEVAGAELRAERAPQNLDASRRRTVSAALNMLRQAIETRFLAALESKAEATVKEFLRVNRNANELAELTDGRVANLYRASQVALHLKPGADIEGMDKFLDVQRKILDDLKNPFQSAMAASNALGSSDPSAGSAEAIALFRGLRRDCIDFAEKAGENLPPEIRDQALAMLDAVD